MYSSIIRIVLALIGLSPALLSLYIVGMVSNYDKLYFSVHLSTRKKFLVDLANFFQTNYLLIIFVTLCLVGVWLVTYARKRLAVGRIELKSVKPGDTNFGPLLLGTLLPLFKIYNPTTADIYYIGGLALIAIVFAVTMKGSFHYNIVLKLILGYRHYEVATTGEITYLLLSRQKIVNRKQVEQFVYLTDHMLINLNDKK